MSGNSCHKCLLTERESIHKHWPLATPWLGLHAVRGSKQDLASNFEGLLAFLSSKNNPQSSLVAQTVKNPLASAGEAGDPGSIPGVGRSPGEGNGTPHFSILAWRIPWTEEPGRVQSMGLQRVGTTEPLTHTHMNNPQQNIKEKYRPRRTPGWAGSYHWGCGSQRVDVWAEPQHQAAVMEGLLEDVQQTPAFEHSPWGPASLCLFLQGTSQGTRAVLPSTTLAQPQVCPQVHKSQPAPRAGLFHSLWGGCLTVGTLQS